MTDDTKKVDTIDEIRRQFAIRNAEGAGADLMTHVVNFAKFLVSERGIAALLLVAVLGFLLTRGSSSIDRLAVSVAACEKSNNAVMYQNQDVIDRVDKQFREIELREQEERLRSLSRRFPGLQQERAE